MNQMIRCPLCGFDFRQTDAVCSHNCPMSQMCKLICCPNCHYEFPQEPASLSWLRRLFKTRPAAAPSGRFQNLSQFDEGQQLEMVGFACAPSARRNALAVYGLVPGSRLVLQQKRPAFVVRVGETELALESDIANEILVRPAEGA